MQLRKTFKNLQPELLYNELKDFLLGQGMTLDEEKLETYSSPTDSSVPVFRGSLIFKKPRARTSAAYVRARLQGTARGETKLAIELDEGALTRDQVTALQDDIHFFMGSYEVEPEE